LADTVDPFVKAAHFMISARNDISFRLCNINKLVIYIKHINNI
jgi:hypothetical protein